MKNIVVVGGGIVGIVSSILLRSKGHNVILIEQSGVLGGLLNSKIYGNNCVFDYGTHVPRETGITEIDQILYSDLDPSYFNEFTYLKVGNFFGGELNNSSQFINTLNLGKEIFNKGFSELVNTQPIVDELLTAEEYLTSFFGETFTKHIFEPLLKKFYGEDLANLQSHAHLLLGLNRLICGNKFTSDTLKNIPFFDEKLAFSSYLQGISPFKSYYPKQNGIGDWTDLLVDKVKRENIQVHTHSSIEKFVCHDGLVERIILENGTTIDCNHLIWTASPISLIKACGIEKTEFPMKHRSVKLVNICFDKPFLVENHYIYCHDHNLKTYRITFYPNLKKNHNDQYKLNNCTIELIGNYSELENVSTEEICSELKTMGIISEGTDIIFEDSFIIRNGFPVLTNTLGNQIKNIETLIQSSLINVITLGKMSGKSFFMEESLRTAFFELNKADLL